MARLACLSLLASSAAGHSVGHPEEAVEQQPTTLRWSFGKEGHRKLQAFDYLEPLRDDQAVELAADFEMELRGRKRHLVLHLTRNRCV